MRQARQCSLQNRLAAALAGITVMTMAAVGCSSQAPAGGYEDAPRQAAAQEAAGREAVGREAAAQGAAAPPSAPAAPAPGAPNGSPGRMAGEIHGEFRGFDRNGYPGDTAMAALRGGGGAQAGALAFTGYWLTPPPGSKTNSWVGKRAFLRREGWGFLLLANGRFDREILTAQKKGTEPGALGRADAAVAVNAARAEGFPRDAILFLDQEEGGRLLPEQAGYLLGWTEAVAATEYRPGVYASGQPVPDDPTPANPHATITTIRDIRARVQAGKLHRVAMFDAEDACPPAPGCTVDARPLSAAGEPDLVAWQYAQSPQRPDITKSCAATYAANGSCYAPGVPGIFLDLDLAREPDPSHGR